MKSDLAVDLRSVAGLGSGTTVVNLKSHDVCWPLRAVTRGYRLKKTVVLAFHILKRQAQLGGCLKYL